MFGRLEFYVQNLCDTGITEPWKLLVREVILAISDQYPQTGTINMSDLN